MILRTAIVALALTICAWSQQSAEPAASAEDLSPQIEHAATPQLMPVSECDKLSSGTEHEDAVAAFCEWVLSFRSRLPDILTDEKMRRMRVDVQHYWETLDVLSVKVHYVDGTVQYSNLAINGKPTTKSIYDLEGSWSTGELGATLEGMLVDVRKSKLKFTKATKLGNRRVLGFEFDVPRIDNGSWTLSISASQKFVPGYRGHIWLDESSFQLVQFERVSTDVDPKFPIQIVTTLTKYAPVKLGDKSDFVLPVSSESVSCLDHEAAGKYTNCLKNILTFENWRKFGAEHRIMTDLPDVAPK